MAEKELKWYSIFVVLFGTILSIADPITDILTLVEFYRADHKTWFGVGLTFLILPSFFFLVINLGARRRGKEEGKCKAWLKYTHILVLGFNPLLPAWLKLRTLFFYLTKLLRLRQDSDIHQMVENLDQLDKLLKSSKFAVLVEAALESAPQFIIQLYAMVVQQESVTIVQMVSLPVSFLSLAWASIVADELIQSDEGDLNFSVKDKVLHFVTHLFTLGGRLFAVALFTVSYKWWVTSVLILHCTVITICDIVWQRRDRDDPFHLVMSFCLYWLRDDLSLLGEFDGYKNLRRMQLFSNVLFVIENITMILLFYFNHFPHTWYSLPVTICVSLFAVLGAVMRLTHFYYLRRNHNQMVDQMTSIECKESDGRRSRSSNSIESLVTRPWLQQYVYETSV